MKEVEDLLALATERAEKYLEGRAKVYSELKDYGSAAYLTIERGNSRFLIMIAGEYAGRGIFLANPFKWDRSDSLENIIGYMLKQEGV